MRPRRRRAPLRAEEAAGTTPRFPHPLPSLPFPSLPALRRSELGQGGWADPPRRRVEASTTTWDPLSTFIPFRVQPPIHEARFACSASSSRWSSSLAGGMRWLWWYSGCCFSWHIHGQDVSGRYERGT